MVNICNIQNMFRGQKEEIFMHVEGLHNFFNERSKILKVLSLVAGCVLDNSMQL